MEKAQTPNLNFGLPKTCKCGEQYYDKFNCYSVCPDCYSKAEKEAKEVKKQVVVQTQQMSLKDKILKRITEDEYYGDYFKAYDQDKLSKQIDLWIRVYRGQDILREFDKMNIWCLANGMKKKWVAFMATWLSKEPWGNK